MFELTPQQYCGHWSDDDLRRTRAAKESVVASLRRELESLMQELTYIHAEQVRRRA